MDTTPERRLRRFVANDKLALSSFFVEWTLWIMSWLETATITLLVDETKLADKLAIMMVGVAYEGRCISLTWRCYEANHPQACAAEGQVEMITTSLLTGIAPGLPEEKIVLLLADRGIGTSPDLCRNLDLSGWSYLFRVTKQSKIITDDGKFTIYKQVMPGEA